MDEAERLYLRTEARAVLCAHGAAITHRPGELRPSGVMRGYVQRVTFSRETFDRPIVERVLPDGAVTLCFDAGTRCAASIAGATARASTIRFGGVLEHVGVQLAPGGIAAVLGAPAREVEGRVVALEDLWGAAGRELVARMVELPLEARPRLILEAIRARLAARDAGVGRAAAGAIRTLVAARGAIRVRDLASAIGLGERRLEQVFAQDVGLSPRAWSRVMRFRSAVDYVTAHPERAWADVARACGYADQAHLVRELRAITGHTPGALARFGFFQSPPDAAS